MVLSVLRLLSLPPMAEIIPFRAWRYNEAAVEDIHRKFSPLFDVVDEEQMAELYQIPNNSIHISVPRSLEEAVEKWRVWREGGVVKQDPLPGFYLCYQDFVRNGRAYTRKGVVAMIRLQPQDIILHEDVLPHSVNDRIALLAATHLNVAPTHGLYHDPDFALEAMMDLYMKDPIHAYIDYQGVTNRFAVVQHPADIALIQRILADRKVYLADGHHRLESSYAWQARALGTNSDSPLLPTQRMANYHLIYLTNLCGDDLRILPTHRVVPDLPVTDWPTALAPWFDVETVALAALDPAQLPAGEHFVCGIVTPSGAWRVRLRDGIQPESLINRDLPKALKRLDYTLLHEFILEQIGGISYPDQLGGQVRYEKNMDRAMTAPQTEGAAAAFIMREVSVQTMLDICDSGAKMPPKSTFFSPKVVCGMVYASVED
jgi:uncharacterized protein (DUF1015 family)